MGRRDIIFRELVQHAVSPIIISRRKNDPSRHLANMTSVIADHYKSWGWPTPAGLTSGHSSPADE
jgi:hypothetical protein